MKNELTFERQHRTAPARHFSGGYTHGPIESDLPPLRPDAWNRFDSLVVAMSIVGAAVAVWGVVQ